MLRPDCPHCGAYLMVRIGWWGEMNPILNREPCQCAMARQQRKAAASGANGSAA